MSMQENMVDASMRPDHTETREVGKVAGEDSPTRVIYRKWDDGSIIAMLLDVPANFGRVTCYEHVGQHGEGEYFGIMTRTDAAKPHEYGKLHRELEQIGYRLIIRRRRSR